MSRQALSIALFAVLSALSACGGADGAVDDSAMTDDEVAAATAGALPISDESEAGEETDDNIGTMWGSSPSPALEIVDEAVPEELEGALVATAKITLGEVEVWETRAQIEPEWLLAVPTEFGGDRHFLVLEEREDWLKIAVPVRPNGTVGWIPRDAVTLSVSRHRVQIDISERSVKVWEDDELILDTTSAVGRDSAPTPLGAFYIRDVLPWDPNSVYGPYVLALSAYSETIDQINGGDAVVAIHGTSSPSLLGSAVSLGCIRLANEDVTLLAETVPVGTPVEVIA